MWNSGWPGILSHVFSHNISPRLSERNMGCYNCCHVGGCVHLYVKGSAQYMTCWQKHGFINVISMQPVRWKNTLKLTHCHTQNESSSIAASSKPYYTVFCPNDAFKCKYYLDVKQCICTRQPLSREMKRQRNAGSLKKHCFLLSSINVFLNGHLSHSWSYTHLFLLIMFVWL